MTKVGIYGGSFNPIHFGHIGLAEWIVTHTDLDEVWLLVSPNNPLKDTAILEDENQRLAAAQAAVAGKAGLRVSDFEFHLPRPSYTANTLRALSEAYPEHEFTLIIGEDNLRIFDKWREYTYILSHYRVFVYPRRGYQVDEIPYHGDIVLLSGAPYFDISSTEIREKFAGTKK